MKVEQDLRVLVLGGVLILEALPSEICRPQMVTLLNWAPTCEWYMASFVKNGDQKDVCCNEIGLCD